MLLVKQKDFMTTVTSTTEGIGVLQQSIETRADYPKVAQAKTLVNENHHLMRVV